MRLRRLVPGVPGHVVAVGGGLVALGVSAFGYLGLAGRALPADAFDALSVAWALVNGIGIGLFVPLEQQTARRSAAAGGRADPAELRRLAVGALGCLAVIGAVAALWAPWLASRLFGGDARLLALLVAAFAGLALAYLVRGLLAGAGQYGRYGWQLGVDGGLRVGGAAVLAAAGVRDAAAYLAVLAAAPVAAVLLTTGMPRALRPPRITGTARGQGIVVLTVASLLAALLANVGPVAVELLATAGDAASAGAFLAVLVVARLPLFLYAAIQAVLLPTLAAAYGDGDPAGFRSRLGVIVGATAALGAAGTLAVAVLGPLALSVVFGARYGSGLGLLLLLAAGGAVMMLATAGAQAVLALHGDGWAALGWACGVVAAVLGCLAPIPLADAVGTGLLAGALVAALVQFVAASALARQWQRRLSQPQPAPVPAR